ncbi:Gfo/Idh/MocA family oxidoreductase [Cesiribacter sp. SM1]|uniref:Gfo/Idh/MocA family oxidoreductase n=1 Tax=Cesiribacter sp. SM1 TaxID=2861196 RepID=UPI001CD811A6|nr:Gfo/Idh/MocA family oxidoreductase [Cesiribacter sp. SM1]
MNSIKTLVVGYGLSAKAFHLPFLTTNPSYEVAGIVQPRGNSAREEFPHLKHFRSLDEALEQGHAELVIISAPNEYHAPMAMQALRKGKHVVIEKPFALSVAEAEAICRVAREHNRLLTVFHNRRWDADFLTLKQLLQEQQLGRPVMLVSRFDRFRPQIKPGWKEAPKQGAGIFYNLAPHLVDQALQLFGWPAELYAHIRTERKEAVTSDAFDLHLYYNEVTVHLGASTLVSATWPRFSLLGTKGSYTKWGMDPQEDLLVAGVLPTTAEWGNEPAEAWGTLVTGDNDSTSSQPFKSQPGNYGAFFAELAHAIMGGGNNPVPPQEALQVMQIMELAFRSQQEGRRIKA